MQTTTRRSKKTIKRTIERAVQRHSAIYLEDRGFWIDKGVLATCQMLWDHGIETFYSCQGGPVFVADNGERFGRGYVQILEVDALKVFNLLRNMDPEIEINPRRVDKDRVVVRFDPVV